MSDTSVHTVDLDVVCHVEPMSEEQLQRARLAICDNATGPDDAARLLAMLGLDSAPQPPARRIPMPIEHSSDADCVGCGRSMVPRTGVPEGAQVRYGGRGMCSTCYARDRRKPDEDPTARLWDLLRDPDWALKASCRDSPEVELWHPDPKQPIDAVVKHACAHCPVFDQCGAMAIVSGATAGVWAGMKLDHARGRAAMRKRYGIPAKLGKRVLDQETKTCKCGNQFKTSTNAKKCWGCREGYCSAVPAQKRLLELQDSGWTLAEIVRISGLSESAVKALKTNQGVRQTTADAIFAVPLLRAAS